MFARVSRLSASIPLWFVAVAFPLALAFLPREAVAQDPCTQFWPPPPPECYGVSVTPKGGVTATRLANTGGYSETFYVSNTGLGDTYAIGCYGTGGVTCTGTSLSELNPGVNTPVTAYYSVGSPGTGTLTLTATGSNASDGGWVTVPIQSFGVTVTPDGGSEPTRVPNTSGYSAAFTVLNTGSGSETYVLTCTSSGNVTCGTVGPGTAQLGANVSKQVIVSYVVGNAGTGTLKLRASSAYSNDSAWYSIPIGQAAGAPIVDLAPYTFDKQDYSRCAVSCFATVYAQSTVPYFSLNAPRNVTLVYNSDRVNPKPFVHVNVSPDPGYGQTPTEYRLQVKVNGAFVTFVNGDTLLKFTYPGAFSARIGGQFDAAASGAGSTNVYPMDIVVTAVYGSGPVTTTLPTKLVVVNETNAATAGGWTIAGIQRLYAQADGSALITEGDGSAVYFWNVGGTLVAPAGEFSTLSGTSGWTRTHTDGSQAVFDATGRMTQARDRFGNATTIVYDASGRVANVTDPANLTITLTYGANGLASVQDAGSPARTTTVTVDAARGLTAITDPDNVSTRFVFDATLQLTKVITRRGDTTQFGYHSSRKLVSITLPPVPIHGSSTMSPTESHSPWQHVGVPYTSTAQTPMSAPAADTVHARINDPRGFVTTFTVNTFGSPVQMTDAVGGATTLGYDVNGLPVRAAHPTSGVDTVAYNVNGLPTYIQSAGLSATNIRYGAFGQPDSIWGTGRPTIVNKLGPSGRVDRTIVGGQDTTRYTYDSRGRVLTVTDPQGHLLVKHVYAGVNGNLSKDSVPGGRVSTYLQDGFGRDTAVQLPGMPLRRTHYDVLNRPTEVFDGVHPNPTVTAYDSLFVRSVTDPKGQVYGFTYNAIGWLTQEIDPAGRAQEYAYDPNGNLKRWVNRRADSVLFAYDGLNRRTSKGGSNTAGATWSYSADRRVITTTSPGLDTETVYLNVAGLADSVRTTLADQTYWRRNRYTAAGLVDSVDISGGGVAFRSRKYVYTTEFGILSEIHLAGAITRIARNKDLQDTSITFPGGDRIRKLFYPLHRATQISNTAPYNGTVARSMSFDSLGRIREQFIGDGSSGNRYTYDGAGRVTSDSTMELVPGQSPPGSCDGDPPPIVDEFGNSCVEGSGGSTWQVTGGARFTYDSVGNRRDNGGTYVAGNRITAFAGCSYATDYDGNVVSRTCGAQTTTYYWSAESRLDSATVGTQRVGFRYDAVGRLVRKDLNGVPQSHFLWQGSNLLAELTSTGTAAVAEYSYYPGLDKPHAVIRSGQEYHAHADGLGNVIALTDGAQLVKRTYSYNTWGATTGGTDFVGFDGGDRARFKGALWLGPEMDVYYMRARWYDPQTGRFLSEDPLGIEGGLNPYVYAGDDPVNGRDPTGLTCYYLVEITYYVDTGEIISVRIIGGPFCDDDGGGGGGSSGDKPQQPQQPQEPPNQCPAGLRWPVGGRNNVTSRFSPARPHPILGSTRPHRGIDIGVPLGTPVVSAGSGVIETAGWNAGGFGNLVEVRDPAGNVLRYAHLDAFAPGLSVGDSLVGGNSVGNVGQTGLATGPNLHFEIRTPDGTAIDPLPCLP